MKQISGLSYNGRSLASRYHHHYYSSNNDKIEMYLRLAIRAEKEGRIESANAWLAKAIALETK